VCRDNSVGSVFTLAVNICSSYVHWTMSRRRKDFKARNEVVRVKSDVSIKITRKEHHCTVQELNFR